MASKVQICNRALVRLGASTIASMTDGDIATTCDIVFDGLKESLIARHPWRFATKKVQLARLVTAPINEWRYAYQFPTDAVLAPHAVFISTDLGSGTTTEFEIFEDKLYADHEVIVIDYRFAAAEGVWPAWFTELMVLALAGAIAVSVTDQEALAAEYNERAFGVPSDNGAGGYFSVCATLNGQSNPAAVIQNFDLVDARFS